MRGDFGFFAKAKGEGNGFQLQLPSAAHAARIGP